MPAQSASPDTGPWPGMDERQILRSPVNLRATLKSDKAPKWQVEVTDVTQMGCRVALAERVSVGTFVTLAIPTFVELVGWVAWSTDGALGVDFSHPLPSGVLEHVVRLSA